MTEFRIEAATLDDLELIARMHLASWRAAYKDLLPDSTLKKRRIGAVRREWKKMLASDPCRTLVARSGQGLVGACAVGDCGDPDLRGSRDSQEIYSISVEPALQRTGIGRSLVQAQVREAAFETVYAWIVVGNRLAETFFKALRFAEEPWTEKDFPLWNRVLRVVRLRAERAQIL